MNVRDAALAGAYNHGAYLAHAISAHSVADARREYAGDGELLRALEQGIRDALAYLQEARTEIVLAPSAADRHLHLAIDRLRGMLNHHTREADGHLLAAATDLLTLAHQYAEECGECAGTRIVPTVRPTGHFGHDEPCTACVDIWQVIDKAEGRS